MGSVSFFRGPFLEAHITAQMMEPAPQLLFGLLQLLYWGSGELHSPKKGCVRPQLIASLPQSAQLDGISSFHVRSCSCGLRCILPIWVLGPLGRPNGSTQRRKANCFLRQLSDALALGNAEGVGGWASIFQATHASSVRNRGGSIKKGFLGGELLESGQHGIWGMH